MRRRHLVALALLAGGALGLVVAALLLGRNADKTYVVPSDSMRPTFEASQEVEVDEDAYEDSEPEIGDVITFHPPGGAIVGNGCGAQRFPGEACARPTPELAGDIVLMKRVVALPADTIAIVEGRTVIEGSTTSEDFIAPCKRGGACNLPVPITVPDDHYFVLGDNRGHSEDSRFFGPVPREAITGRVVDD